MATTALHLSDDLDYLTSAATPAEKHQDSILLIEDNEDAMELVLYALEEHGNGLFRLVWANNLTKGLEQLEKNGVDLVLLDLGLPESSGSASYTCLRQVSPEVPVVVLTGDTKEDTESSMLAAGVDEYLIKDKTSGRLLMDAIRSALEASGRRQKLKSLSYEQQFRWTFMG